MPPSKRRVAAKAREAEKRMRLPQPPSTDEPMLDAASVDEAPPTERRLDDVLTTAETLMGLLRPTR
jgi:hypothetical protein